jgi:acyl-phosphate glycerol 3-phosphate acyltransferase
VDIFTTGNTRAGTANVFWNISRPTGVLVFMADVAKGSLAVIIAGLLDLSGPALILAAGAAVLGHWKSIFTGFRGGDGMATLLGVSITLVPLLTLLGIIFGFLVLLLFRHSPFRSAWGIAACLMVLLSLSQFSQVDRALVLGIGVLAVLVLGHSILIHRRRAPAPSPDQLTLELAVDEVEEEPGLGATTPENR